MASYHFAMKTSKNSSACAGLHYEYICREGKYGLGEKAEELIYKEHGNMPEWARENPRDFWQASQDYERANGTTYREIELALPNELPMEEQIQLTKQFVNEHLGHDFAYSYAIHSNDARLAKNVCAAFDKTGEIQKTQIVPLKNPHAHIMFCERKLDGVKREKKHFFKQAHPKHAELGGAKKDERWNGKNRPEHLKMLRESWANMQNRALAKAGHSVKVDHRTLEEQRKEALKNGDKKKAQELDRQPEKHLGPKVAAFPKSFTIGRDDGKIRVVMASREYKMLLNSIKECQRRIELLKALNEHQTTDVKQKNTKEINLSVKEIRDICDKRIKAVKGQAEIKRQEYKEAMKQVLSPERAYLIAQSVYFKGEPKRIREEARKINNESTEFSKRKKVFLEKPKPQFYQMSYQAEYKKEANMLLAWQRDLASRKEANEKKAKAVAEKSNLPAVKAKVAKIQENILRKNAVKKEAAENIRAQSEALKIEKKRIVNLKAQLTYEKNSRIVKIVQAEGAASAGKAYNQPDKDYNQSVTASDLLRQADKIVRQLEDTKSPAVGLRAKINTDDDENERKVKHRL